QAASNSDLAAARYSNFCRYNWVIANPPVGLPFCRRQLTQDASSRRVRQREPQRRALRRRQVMMNKHHPKYLPNMTGPENDENCRDRRLLSRSKYNAESCFPASTLTEVGFCPTPP